MIPEQGCSACSYHPPRTWQRDALVASGEGGWYTGGTDICQACLMLGVSYRPAGSKGNTERQAVNIWPWSSLSQPWARIREGKWVHGYGECWKSPESTHKLCNLFFHQTQLLTLTVNSDCWLDFSSRALVTARATKQHIKHFKGYKIISVCYNPNTTVQTVCHRNISCCQFLLLKLQLLALEQINKDIFSFHSIFY